MASKAIASIAILLTLNLLFFTMVSSQCLTPPPPKSLSPKPSQAKPSQAKPSPKPVGKGSCPKDTLKFGVCANVLKNLVNIVLGKPPKIHCCTLIKGLVDLHAGCLFTAMKANVLGLNLNIPVSLTLLLNYCGKKVPSGFQCT
ncbi:14 kDa proline-rich protein DC2.15-like [Macadamia integrifolia]|uniref:14 kDa proline-rich protein DC2.15-like n=1 Tax=Macadamia integrifolia TaxID=60698 RepID=UPI001C502352|nr:14 kDa proline-rich protein DC2.15-like [Macadamia integrifolia]